ncbi:MAG TPA: dihydroorotase family protein, partial [bacterium]|nr:dihydroorotase family protein [bacterium]
CDPPLRAQPNREQLWEHVRDGTIDFFASDHAPFSIEQKEKGHTDMWQVPMGIPGLQTMLPLVLDEAFRGQGLSLVEFARLSATAAARLFGLYPKKGAIRVGSDADLVLWDLNAPWTIDRNRMLTRHRWSPFEGRVCGVRAVMTLVRGRAVYADSRVIGQAGYGQFMSPLDRSASSQFQPSLPGRGNLR